MNWIENLIWALICIAVLAVMPNIWAGLLFVGGCGVWLDRIYGDDA